MCIRDSYIFRSGAINDLLELSTSEITRLKNHEIDISKYNCRSNEAISNIDDYGYTAGRFAFFNNSTGWTAPTNDFHLLGSSPPSVDKNSNSIIQCKEDDVIGKDYRYQGTEYEELSNFSYYNSTGNKYANYYGFFNTGRFYNWPNGYNVIFSGNYLNYLGEKGSSDNPETSYNCLLYTSDAADE